MSRKVDELRRQGAPNFELIPEGRGFLLVEFGSDDPGLAEHDEAAQISSAL
jgi:hypothetical protein